MKLLEIEDRKERKKSRVDFSVLDEPSFPPSLPPSLSRIRTCMDLGLLSNALGRHDARYDPISDQDALVF